MVCGDYRHAGMMSCSGCVHACASSQILYNMPSYVHIKVYAPCLRAHVHSVCVCSCVYVAYVCVGVVCEYCVRVISSVSMSCLALIVTLQQEEVGPVCGWKDQTL